MGPGATICRNGVISIFPAGPQNFGFSQNLSDAIRINQTMGEATRSGLGETIVHFLYTIQHFVHIRTYQTNFRPHQRLPDYAGRFQRARGATGSQNVAI